MTDGGKIMVNETFEMQGSELNDMGKTEDGITDRRRRLLGGTAAMAQAEADGQAAFEGKESMTSGEYQERMNAAKAQYNEGKAVLTDMRHDQGMEFLDEALGKSLKGE